MKTKDKDTHANIIRLERYDAMALETHMIERLRCAYVDSFPEDERRPWEEIVSEVRSLELFLLWHDAQIIGFVTLWRLPTCLFAEHLVILEQYRNRGFGTNVIRSIMATCGTSPLVLETEPSDMGDMARRRLGLYQRLGLAVQTDQYIQPAYTPAGHSVRLCLMASQPLQDTASIITSLYREVYLR